MSNLHAMPVQEQDTKWTQKESIEQVKILTTPSPLVKVEPTLSQISSLRLPHPTDLSQGTQTIRSRKTPQRSEKETTKELVDFFDAQGWDYRTEWVTKSGKAIDYLVKAPYDGGHIFFGVECKADLNEDTKATVLADYLEQASAYSRDLNMPVFLAPIINDGSMSAHINGGREMDRLSALNIFGGRFNVGTIIKQERWWQGFKTVRWFFILRGAYFWNSNTGFNKAKLQMVCSTGSAKERENIKVWR